MLGKGRGGDGAEGRGGEGREWGDPAAVVFFPAGGGGFFFSVVSFSLFFFSKKKNNQKKVSFLFLDFSFVFVCCPGRSGVEWSREVVWCVVGRRALFSFFFFFWCAVSMETFSFFEVLRD